ncbi:NAD(P)H-binding protein [Chitinophaga nivalis]|uniref:SDR family oxidoreductase n=1 Tax=Chitinophaga nivalis TaxID=2991709 RepID=A0ABT3INI2_9BACT|nr:NAD(P)-binding oxidoreductase [Chitinophaga nivalis]MCW3464784.1 SDR family oxidoreductase [Chitinophaga nivalis]MCW3485525.1 SDR family oxidoreductase [Chitinophaga nivalis]
MITLVVGASGATGKLLIDQLLSAGQWVKILVRATSQIPDAWLHHARITVLRVNDITRIPVNELSAHLQDCQSVAVCLGHTLNLKGIYGPPRRLVTDMVQLLCTAIRKNTPEKPFRFVLMNTAGNSNRDLNEPVSFGQKIVIGLLRLLLPPHPDNEKAADYLRLKTGGQNPFIEWVAVRPDSLINNAYVTAYTLHPSPTRSALFNPGQTSRINVSHFMAQLLTDDNTWHQWKGQMPVIYNATTSLNKATTHQPADRT